MNIIQEPKPLKPVSERSTLLVNKYSPKSFMELLTNEKFNREVLRWVMEFNNQIEPLQKTVNNFFKSNSKYGNNQGFEPKILLLAGPPGIGKTTLAHIVAKHAKYTVYEVNASDDRSPEDMKNIITNLSTQDVATLGKQQNNGKLLILDEIDGIGGKEAKSFIDILLKYAYSKKKKKQKKSKELVGSGNNAATSASEDTATAAKTNPIICICNDPYAPALRELRLKSKLFVFKRDQFIYERITERLKQICKLEKLDIPSRVLTDLVTTFDGDIRSCLNTLQYLKNHFAEEEQHQSELDAIVASLQDAPDKQPKTSAMDKQMKIYEEKQNRQKQLVAALVANKDTRKDFFEVCKKIFYNPNGANKRGVTLDTISTWSNAEVSYDKLMEGCFENYPSMRYIDNHMKHTFEAMDMLSYSDNINQFQRRTQNYSLLPYTVLPFMTFHINCAQVSQQPQFAFPKIEYEVSQRKKQNENICKTLISGAQPETRRFMSLRDTQLDFVPLIPRLLIPTTKQSNPQLLNNVEKKEIEGLVDTCIQYGVTYKQVYFEGKTVFSMDP